MRKAPLIVSAVICHYLVPTQSLILTLDGQVSGRRFPRAIALAKLNLEVEPCATGLWYRLQ